MKKYRLKKKNPAIFVFILIIIIVIIINPIKRKTRSDLLKMNYQKDSVSRIMDYGLKKSTLNHDYSEFVDKTILDENFIIDNYPIYLDLDYYDKSNSLDNVNKLIDKGYSTEEINLILKSGNNNTIKSFVDTEKYDNITEYLKFDYAKLSLLDRYIEYKASNVCTYKDAIIKVNIGLDNDFYENYVDVTKFSLTMIVNKYHKLSEDFVPDDLVDIPKELIIDNSKEKANRVVVKLLKRWQQP